MNGTKPWYTSKTIWGSLVAILASLLGLWDFDVSAQDQARLVDTIVQLLGAGGGLLALVGRLVAVRRLG